MVTNTSKDLIPPADYLPQLLQAQLKGKLTREEENLEDLLTSNVFGTVEYLPAQDGLFKILSSIREENGSQLSYEPDSVIFVEEYKFWPWIKESGCEGCEPDVLVTIQFSDAKKMLILVEAKYMSGLSSDATEENATPTDQLAKEWDNLVLLARRQAAAPVLLYVTADFGYPSQTIANSKEEYRKKRGLEMSVFWISWRNMPRIFASSPHHIVRHLVMVLRRQGLTFFEGITCDKPVAIRWRFEVSPPSWNWSVIPNLNVSWTFETGWSVAWGTEVNDIKWGFSS